MIEPTSGGPPVADALTDAQRDTRIEQLLVSGLEEYFAGRMDQAVNVWTRVLFLDRSNDRARAYIDRARRAQAERQRESDAMMHQGLQAFDEGDVDQARRLLTAAVERGAPHEQALPVLHRIGLLEVAPSDAAHLPARGRWRRGERVVAPGPPSRLGPWLLALAIAALGAVAVFVSDNVAPQGLAALPVEYANSLPLPAASEGHLARARQLFAAGKLPDVLSVLDRIEPGDAAYVEAQALRARVQRELLAAAGPGGQEAPPR